MLIIFKSPACGDVTLFESNASQALGVLGKDAGARRGVVTVEQLPAATSALRAAIAADRLKHRCPPADDADDTEAPGGSVAFYQRAVPLLALLEHALKEGTPVTWGV
ncbi:MAG: DUF1840 domain-containing protein [Azonexus sp.]|jgi:hypothetical protein|nr:DUF1840 domain-containing protein [Betaproteobacteria bacterium]MBK8918664.1 DUF1840 domain-containing protein [Betaproteobacteria bacterium]MBP6034597.1 DUF1840 domain-containing protein [Azonexus sp.]MBP6905137.1 DUF1840 domain-containing protein [Azonexus sp.]